MLGFFDKVKDAVDKVKEGAKTYAKTTPQGQAVTAAQKAFQSKSAKSATSSSIMPSRSGSSSRVIPSSKGADIVAKIKGVFTGQKTKLMGIPVLFVGLGVGAIVFLKMRRRK